MRSNHLLLRPSPRSQLESPRSIWRNLVKHLKRVAPTRFVLLRSQTRLADAFLVLRETGIVERLFRGFRVSDAAALCAGRQVDANFDRAENHLIQGTKTHGGSGASGLCARPKACVQISASGAPAPKAMKKAWAGPGSSQDRPTPSIALATNKRHPS